jgi:AcrR family transcriptional regulator
VPRIDADPIATHVARREAAVVEAASRLFAERGVPNVTLADIATEVGIARNSIYRYFPDKAHLVAAWFRSDLEPLLEVCSEIAERDAPPATRLREWMTVQLDALRQPRHSAMVAAVTDLLPLPDDVQADIGEGHQRLYATLGRIVTARRAEVGLDHDVDRVVTMLVAGLLQSTAQLIERGADPEVAHREMCRAADAVVTAHDAGR